jgi:hypothetical protein
VRVGVNSAVIDRTVFRGFREVSRENDRWIRDHHGARFCQFIARAYVARVALAVRRHSREHKDAVTLAGLLEQMEKCAPQLTFEFFLGRFPGGGSFATGSLRIRL